MKMDDKYEGVLIHLENSRAVDKEPTDNTVGVFRARFFKTKDVIS